MNFSEFKKKTEAVQQITAPKEWRTVAREQLLASIRAGAAWRQAPAYPRWGITDLASLVMGQRSLARVALVMALIISLVSSTSFAAVSVARASLPGEAFYGIKISLERAQIGLAISEEKKAELEIGFAGGRLEEVTELLNKPADSGGQKPQKDAAVAEAINHFNSGMQAVQERLEKAEERSVVDLSRFVGEQTIAMETSLLEIKEKLVHEEASAAESAVLSATGTSTQEEVTVAGTVSGSLSSIDSALVAVDQANTKSLAVIVAKATSSSDAGITQEAVSRLQNKIERVSKKVEAAEQLVQAFTAVANATSTSAFLVPASATSSSATSVLSVLSSPSASGAASTSTATILQGSTATSSAASLNQSGGTSLKSAVEQVQNKPEEAKRTIEEARVLLDGNTPEKLKQALDKVQETSQIVQQVDATIKSVVTPVKPASEGQIKGEDVQKALPATKIQDSPGTTTKSVEQPILKATQGSTTEATLPIQQR